MTQADPSPWLLAASGGDTVKLFDTKVQHSDPCVLSYTPSPGSTINSVKWNHTNLVVASAGEDKKISLWRRNGQSMGTIPVSGADNVDGIEESIMAISFSNKGSRYICSGGSGQVVRIWDLQRKRCIKWLKGHSSMITGAMYNSKDEHLASISLGGDLILHNLSSGARATELKDPNQQILRVLDYSRISRHLLVTAGDDGTVHLWDATGRSPKVSWLKQHSAPTAGVSFSPSNDKTIASVGMDKKLYMYDSGSRRPASSTSYEAPFSSLSFKDDGWTLAAGTSNGRVVFYDVRGKLQPFTVLRAYSSSEAVTSLSWQRSKPVIVNESTCTAETALLGNAIEDSILMPDPLPSLASSNLSQSTAASMARLSGRSASAELSSLTTTTGTSSIFTSSSTTEETPQRSLVWPGGKLTRLQAPRNFKDDMDVFSPITSVEPITLSPWADHEGAKKDLLSFDKKPSPLLFPSSRGRFALAEGGANDHPISDWKSRSASKQDDTLSSFTTLGSTPPPPSSKSEESLITPPEAWGSEKLSDKLAQLRHHPSRLGISATAGLASSSVFPGTLDLTSTSSLSSSLPSYESLFTNDVYANQDSSIGLPEHFSSSMSLSQGTKAGAANLDSPRFAYISRRFNERISTTSANSDGVPNSVASPKTKKTGVETRELVNSLLSRAETSAAPESGTITATNGGSLQPKALQPDPQQGSNFSVQLIQRTLEGAMDTFQKSSHEDVRNLHIEIIRQSHMQSMETTSLLTTILENQAELMKEVKCLRQEIQQIRQLL